MVVVTFSTVLVAYPALRVLQMTRRSGDLVRDKIKIAIPSITHRSILIMIIIDANINHQ